MLELEPVSLATAEKLIDFTGGNKDLESLAKLQLEGAVALQNMIATPEVGIAYLADEVGMGKTYMALGVVTLMRFFNPALRVLFIAPKNNVREKWVNEYKSFIASNYRLPDGINKGLDGKPAVPFRECLSVTDLLQAASTGQAGDFFICGSAFSFALDDEESELQRRLRLIAKYVPALGRLRRNPRKLAEDGSLKEAVKEEYAKALNYALPLFDLVVVDECHNFKSGLASSHRNRMLARILGAWKEDGTSYQCRVRNALLLSATPFDRDLKHLENQLELFGKSGLMAGTTSDNYEDILSRFMVRRLNAIHLTTKNGSELTRHTRNMYRTEHRSGPVAEIRLCSDEQKLFTALIQKKVSDVLDRDFGGKFQTGMLASFESYLPATVLKTAEFDGNNEDKKSLEASDGNVIEQLVASFRETFIQLPPHPKMDEVSRLLHQDTFEGSAKKQLIFVRRVKSVSDLKAKLDERYDGWLQKYLRRHLQDSRAMTLLEKVWPKYEQIARNTDRLICEGETMPDLDGDDNQPPQNDNFFTWFFRGGTHPEIASLFDTGDDPTPEEVRKQLTQKSSPWSLLFEFNWRELFRAGCSDEFLEGVVARMPAMSGTQGKAEPWRDYMACQIAFLEAISREGAPRVTEAAQLVLQQCFGADLESLRQPTVELSAEKIGEYLRLKTFFSLLNEKRRESLSDGIFPLLSKIPDLFAEAADTIDNGSLLRNIDIHRELLGTLVRIDHVFIDLYIARLKESGGGQSLNRVLHEFVRHLELQKINRLSSRRILTDLAQQFPLILKLNFGDVSEQTRKELRRYIVKQISPLAPVIGASGETSGNRSSQARKFRMPGYPLMLVSTDVFQEGEDLHTFCDRVTHYGISSSPIALEQKVGRVDRVHSLAQRNLLQHKRSIKKHFIRVFYPHIRETIEYQQMYNVAHSLNQFIKSLHRVGACNLKICDIQDSNQVVTDRIPRQILTALESPFEAKANRTANRAQLSRVRTVRAAVEGRVLHLRKLVVRLKKRFQESSIDYRIGDGLKCEKGIELRLRSARTSDNLVLSASAPVIGDDGLIWTCNDGKSLLKRLKKLEDDPSYRVIAREEEKGGYRLVRNVEIYVEDPECLHLEEVENLLDRVAAKGALPAVVAKRGLSVAQLFRDAKKWLKENPHRFPSTGFTFDGVKGEAACSFRHRGQARRHSVHAEISTGYLVLTAAIASAARVREIANQHPDSLVRMTLLRNAHVDLVEMHFSNSGRLIGRICHPLAHLQPVEFLCCLHTLAMECDLMEYLLETKDSF